MRRPRCGSVLDRDFSERSRPDHGRPRVVYEHGAWCWIVQIVRRINPATAIFFAPRPPSEMLDASYLVLVPRAQPLDVVRHRRFERKGRCVTGFFVNTGDVEVARNARTLRIETVEQLDIEIGNDALYCFA